MPIDKRAVRQQFKEKKNPKGVFAVRCKVTGEVWVSASRDLAASQTSTWFMLRNGYHHTKSLQVAWNLHGAEVFEYQVLENFDQDLPPLTLQDALRDRQKHWAKELSATLLQVG